MEYDQEKPLGIDSITWKFQELAIQLHKAEQRIKHLEGALRHIHAESEAYVLNNNGYKSAPVHKMYGRLAKKYLREE